MNGASLGDKIHFAEASSNPEKYMRTRSLNLRMLVHLHSPESESSRSPAVSEAWLFITVQDTSLETSGLRLHRSEAFPDLNPPT